MNCKYCGILLDEEQNICPSCGAANASDVPEAVEEVQSSPAEQTNDDDVIAGDEDVLRVATEDDLLGPEVPHAAPQKPGKGLLICLGIVALAAVAALVLALTGMLGGTKTPAGDPTEVLMLDKDGVFIAHDFSKPNDQITQELADTVVAKSGDAKLTNAQLSYYYWQQYYNLYTTYGEYISYIIDTTKPLSEQMYDDTHSWQDKLLQTSVTAFRQNSALCAAAEKAGFEIDAEYESYLTTMGENMDTDAKGNGYESGEDYLKSFYGPYSNLESYLQYARTSFLASSYLQSLYETISYEPADVETYFDEHPEDYAEQNLTKEDPNVIDVRHILIQPVADEGAEPSEDGSPVYTDENWAVAKEKADEVYALWQAGEMTEDAFAALAATHSVDGSKDNGGLYEDVAPGQMVPEFNDWCFDPARQAGDFGMVKTTYGYHIMYFSAVGEHPQWYTLAETALQQSLQQKLVEDLAAKTKFKFDHTKVVIGESDLVEVG